MTTATPTDRAFPRHVTSRTLLGYSIATGLIGVSVLMRTSTLPLYLVSAGFSISTVAAVEWFSLISQAALRVRGGYAATNSNTRRAALAGYRVSLPLRALIVLPFAPLVAAATLTDRLIMSYRVAPRDTLIAAEADRARIPIPAAFALNGRFDTVGATAGPLAAAAILAVKPGAYTLVFAIAMCISCVDEALLGWCSRNTPTIVRHDGEHPPSSSRNVVPAVRAALTGLVAIPLPVVILTVIEGKDRDRLPLWIFLAAIVTLAAVGGGTRLAARFSGQALTAAPLLGVVVAAAVAALPHSPYTPAIVAVLTGLQLCVADAALAAITALEDSNPARLGWSAGGLAFGRSVGLAATALFGGFTLPWVIPTCAVAAVGLAAINRYTTTNRQGAS